MRYDRIIEPITSRCSKFRFKPLDNSNALSRLEHICKEESVQCSSSALESLIRISEGDLRRAITFLQSASKLAKASALPTSKKDEDDAMEGGEGEDGMEITQESVLEIGGVVPEGLMLQFAEALGVGENGGNVKNGFKMVQEAVTKVVREGYSATQVLSQVSLPTLGDGCRAHAFDVMIAT